MATMTNAPDSTHNLTVACTERALLYQKIALQLSRHDKQQMGHFHASALGISAWNEGSFNAKNLTL